MSVTLDTSGVVPPPGSEVWPGDLLALAWEDLSPFCQGYVEAALTSFGDVPTIRPRGPGEFSMLRSMIMEHKPAAFSDLHPDTLARFMEDCERFREANPGISTHREHGRWFWDARQNRWQHGDPGLVEDFPPLRLYLSPDGKVLAEEVG